MMGRKSGAVKNMESEHIGEKPVAVLLDIDYTFFDTEKFKKSGRKEYSLYPGNQQVLQDLSQITDLGIFSQEISPVAQIRKLEETGVRKLFHDRRIHLYADKLAEMRRVLEEYRSGKKIVVVDDKLRVLEMAKRINPDVVTIWVNRGPYAEEEPQIEGFKPDMAVEDLLEIVPFVQSLCAEFSVT